MVNTLLPISQAPLCAQWDDIYVGLKVEVLNTHTALPSKVYWIATVVQLTGTLVFPPPLLNVALQQIHFIFYYFYLY